MADRDRFRLISIDAVQDLTSLTEEQVLTGSNTREFPPPVMCTDNGYAWRECEVLNWIADRIEARNQLVKEQAATRDIHAIHAVDTGAARVFTDEEPIAAAEAADEATTEPGPDQPASTDSEIVERVRQRNIQVRQAAAVAHAAYRQYIAWCEREDVVPIEPEAFADYVQRRIESERVERTETVH
ncbi:MAG: AlpA family phage regulatory protein [Hyphomicrobiaceae bacterium]